MNITTFTESNKQDYINFVTAHESGSFLQSWSWGDFQNTQNKKTNRIGIYDNNILIGTAQLQLIKIPHLRGYYVYIPYGPLIDSAENKDLAIMTMETYIKESFPGSWFTRFEPKNLLPLHGSATQRIQPAKTLVTNISQDVETLLSEMHPKTRYNIKLSKKHGIVVETDNVLLKSDETNDFIELLTQTSSRQNYHSYPASYYQSMLNYFSQNDSNDCKLTTYRATYNDSLISGAIMIDCANTRTYLFGGSSDQHRNVMAPYALHWQSIQDAIKLSITKYDWWGIETATGKLPGFVQFKLKWGGDQVTYPQAIDVVQKKSQYVVYKILRQLNRLF